MAYPTTKELVEASSVAALTDLEEAQQDALRTEAITAIEAYTGQSFTAEGTKGEPVERLIDGSGARVQYLPKRLIEVVDLEVPGGAITEADVVLSEDGDRIHLPNLTEAGSTWADRAIADITGSQQTVFPTGPGSVTVSGVWGWSEVPAAVVTALRMDMEDRALANAHALSESVRSARALGLSSVNQGGLSIDLGGAEPEVSTRVARQLADYVWSVAPGALA